MRSYQSSGVEVEDARKETCWLYCNDTQTNYILNDGKLSKMSADFELELIAE